MFITTHPYTSQMLTIPGLGSRSDSIYYISWKRHSSCLFCLKPSQHRRGTCHHVFYGLNGTRRQLLTRKGKAVGFLFGLKYIFLTFYKNRRSRSLDGTSTLPLNYQGNNIFVTRKCYSHCHFDNNSLQYNRQSERYFWVLNLH